MVIISHLDVPINVLGDPSPLGCWGHGCSLKNRIAGVREISIRRKGNFVRAKDLKQEFLVVALLDKCLRLCQLELLIADELEPRSFRPEYMDLQLENQWRVCH